LRSQRGRGGGEAAAAARARTRCLWRGDRTSGWEFTPPVLNTRVPDLEDLEAWADAVTTGAHVQALPGVDERGIDPALLCIGAASLFLGQRGRPRSGPLGKLLEACRKELEALTDSFTVAPWLAGAVDGRLRRGVPLLPASFTTDSIAINCSLLRVRRTYRWVQASKAADCHGKVYDSDFSKSFPCTHVDAFVSQRPGKYALSVLDEATLRRSGARWITCSDPGCGVLATGYKARLETYLDRRGEMMSVYENGDFLAGRNRKHAGVYCGASFLPGAQVDDDGGHAEVVDAAPAIAAGQDARLGQGADIPSDGRGGGDTGAGDRGEASRWRRGRGWRRRRARARQRHAARRREGYEAISYYQIPKRTWHGWSGGYRPMPAAAKRRIVARVRSLKRDLKCSTPSASQKRRKRRTLRAMRRWLRRACGRPTAVQDAVAKLETEASRFIPNAVDARESLIRRLDTILNRNCYWGYFGSVTRRRDTFRRAQQRQAALERVVGILAPANSIAFMGDFGGRRAIRAERGRSPTKAVQRALERRTRVVYVPERMTSCKCPHPNCQVAGARPLDKSTYPTSKLVRRRKDQVEKAKRELREQDPGARVSEEAVQFLPFRKSLTSTVYCSRCQISMNRDLRASFAIGLAAYGYIVEGQRPAFLCTQTELDRRGAAAREAATASTRGRGRGRGRARGRGRGRGRGRKRIRSGGAGVQLALDNGHLGGPHHGPTSAAAASAQPSKRRATFTGRPRARGGDCDRARASAGSGSAAAAGASDVEDETEGVQPRYGAAAAAAAAARPSGQPTRDRDTHDCAEDETPPRRRPRRAAFNAALQGFATAEDDGLGEAEPDPADGGPWDHHRFT
jgi:hypothetical protein